MANKPAIIETKTVVVSFHEVNDYGDMIFSDMDGEEYKIASKRPGLFGLIQDERAVTLGFAEYQGHKYIAEASLPADNLKPPVKAKTQPVGDVPKPPNRQIAVTTSSDRDKLILRQVAFKGAIEYAVHGLIPLEDVEIWANRFNEYLNK